MASKTTNWLICRVDSESVQHALSVTKATSARVALKEYWETLEGYGYTDPKFGPSTIVCTDKMGVRKTYSARRP